jgi:hypothetical protein
VVSAADPLRSLILTITKKINSERSTERSCVKLTTLPPSASRLSVQCGILGISRSYRPPWPDTRLALSFYVHIMFVLLWKDTDGLPQAAMAIALLFCI